MLKFNRSIMTVVTLSALAFTARPLAAQTVAECYEKILLMCDEALANSKWYEKPIIGAMCTAMLIGCNTTITK